MGDAAGDGVETGQVVLWDAEYGLTLNKVVLEGACCEFKAPGLHAGQRPRITASLGGVLSGG